jgi:hypothetical protein
MVRIYWGVEYGGRTGGIAAGASPSRGIDIAIIHDGGVSKKTAGQGRRACPVADSGRIDGCVEAYMRGRYDEDEARRIMDSVCGFLKKLSFKLSE